MQMLIIYCADKQKNRLVLHIIVERDIVKSFKGQCCQSIVSFCFYEGVCDCILLRSLYEEGERMSAFRMSPVGDQAILCEFDNVIDEKTNDQVQHLAMLIKCAKMRGVTELLPAYRSLLIFYDASQTSYQKLSRRLSGLRLRKISYNEEKKKVRIVPCTYGGMLGPDLTEMAGNLGLSEEEVIKIHQSVVYKIYMLGFLPGFVYLGGLDERIYMPRLSVPRTKIPARSVGIGGNQTGVYPMESPGGWRLIGSTPLDFYDQTASPPVLCRAGEYIRFVSVTEQEYLRIRSDVINGRYRAEFA